MFQLDVEADDAYEYEDGIGCCGVDDDEVLDGCCENPMFDCNCDLFSLELAENDAGNADVEDGEDKGNALVNGVVMEFADDSWDSGVGIVAFDCGIFDDELDEGDEESPSLVLLLLSALVIPPFYVITVASNEEVWHSKIISSLIFVSNAIYFY